VPRIVICTPPDAAGDVDPATLFVARELGIREVYRVGGAQAIAAVAWGTRSIPRCDKVVGPGNVYVSAARQLLADRIDPGSPAGPSESLVLADGSARPENVAWNLMIEAEHGENSCAVLVTHARELPSAVAEAVARFADRLPEQRRAYVEQVLSRRGGIVTTRDLAQSVEFANRFAAEHLALMVREPWAVLPRIRHAGEILLGDYPVMSLANYAMGINAILPTGGQARSYSPVSVRDFLKSTSIGFVTAAGFGRLKEIVPPISIDEGFAAHHEAILNWESPDAGESR
jgi:histidinol dehydrogenase